MEGDDLVRQELMLNRFRRLMKELRRGSIRRSDFHSWEVEILLDIESCHVETRQRANILRQYERAVERQLESGGGPPLKLSEFLHQRERRRRK